MGTNRTLAELLGRNRQTITTINDNAEIKECLTTFGIPDEQLAQGVSLLEKVEAHFERQKKEYAEAYAANQVFIEARELAKETFKKDVKLLRIAGKSNVELGKLLPSSISTVNTEEFYKTAAVVYQNLANNPDYAPALATVGLKSALFSERIARLKEVERLQRVRDKEMAEANVATSLRDDELDELQAYCNDLRTMAKIVLEGKPTLKKLVEEL